MTIGARPQPAQERKSHAVHELAFKTLLTLICALMWLSQAVAAEELTISFFLETQKAHANFLTHKTYLERMLRSELPKNTILDRVHVDQTIDAWGPASSLARGDLVDNHKRNWIAENVTTRYVLLGRYDKLSDDDEQVWVLTWQFLDRGSNLSNREGWQPSRPEEMTPIRQDWAWEDLKKLVKSMTKELVNHEKELMRAEERIVRVLCFYPGNVISGDTSSVPEQSSEAGLMKYLRDQLPIAIPEKVSAETRRRYKVVTTPGYKIPFICSARQESTFDEALEEAKFVMWGQFRLEQDGMIHLTASLWSEESERQIELGQWKEPVSSDLAMLEHFVDGILQSLEPKLRGSQ